MDSRKHSHRLKYFLQATATSLLLVLGLGCSNPLSGSNDHLQNFHSKNINCDELNFSGATISVDEIRSLTHCINAHGEIDALDTLFKSLPDSDLQPYSTLINDLISKQPKVLYAFRDSYTRAKRSGDLKTIEQTIAKLFASSERNANSLKVIQKVSTSLISALFDPNLNASLSNLYVLSRAQAYQRLGHETLETENLKNLFSSVVRYLNTSDAKSLSVLYKMIADGGMGENFNTLIARDEQTRVQNLAHFFEWFLSEGRFNTFSSGVNAMLTKPVVCFAGSKTISNPLATVSAELSQMSTAEAKNYFTHDVKNLYLTAQGYCEFPYQASAVLKLIDQATKIPGFDEVFTLVKPLLSDTQFIEFLGSSAANQFVKDTGFLANQHFFEDLFTILALHQQNPITNDGAKISTLLDSLLKPLSDSEARSLVDFVSPLMTAREMYGTLSLKSLYRVSYGFPNANFEIAPALREALIQSTRNIVMRSEVSAVLDLSAKLIEQLKFDGLVDQTLVYLTNLFDRGKFNFLVPRFKDPATITLPSVVYLVDKISDPLTPRLACEDLEFDWNFSQFSPTQSSSYLSKLDAIQACVNSNQTFAKARDLAQYSISNGSFSFFLKTQKTLVNTMFKVDQDQFLTTVDDFLALNSNDTSILRSVINLTSLSSQLVKDSFLKKTELRKTMAEVIRDPLTYQVAAELSGPKPVRLRTSEPTIDLPNLTRINVIVTRDQKLNQVPIEDAVKAIVMEYCPSLDTTRADCDIDSDQIAAYLSSPKKLFQTIAHEELDSSQSWLHPNLQTGWTHQTTNPAQVSTFEFHLNPTLHLFRNAPNAPQSLLTALSRVKKDKMDLASFLKERAVKVTLIPYIYQVPNYPAGSNKEYHNRIRLRIVTDLDRLELIAINADFKAFNLVSNIGMGFIREIGLAWGDVPEDQRPATLARLLGRNDVKTLKQVKEYIESEMSKFDRNILQSLGNCDPRGRSLVGRWLIARTCSSEIFDVSARMFNLRFLISLLGDELPVRDGGVGGLEFLRDLFYSLYEGNTDAQRNNFANGVSLRDECMDNPLEFANPNRNCQKDLLTMISRVTHLGLMHQAGVAILQAKDHPIDAVSSVIDRVSLNSDLADLFVKTLSSDGGIQFIEDSVDYGFQSPEGTAKNLSILTQMMTIPKDLTWVNLILEMIPKDPHFPAENKALINSLLSIKSEALKPWVDQWLANDQRPTPQFLNSVSKKLTPSTRADAIQLLLDLNPNSKTFAQYLTTAKNLPDLQSDRLSRDLNAWATRFADPSFSQSRGDLADWTLTPEFTKFCDVFSDSTFTAKAYNFLESVNQNADSKAFVQSCRDFLNLH